MKLTTANYNGLWVVGLKIRDHGEMFLSEPRVFSIQGNNMYLSVLPGMPERVLLDGATFYYENNDEAIENLHREATTGLSVVKPNLILQS